MNKEQYESKINQLMSKRNSIKKELSNIDDQIIETHFEFAESLTSHYRDLIGNPISITFEWTGSDSFKKQRTINGYFCKFKYIKSYGGDGRGVYPILNVAKKDGSRHRSKFVHPSDLKCYDKIVSIG